MLSEPCGRFQRATYVQICCLRAHVQWRSHLRRLTVLFEFPHLDGRQVYRMVSDSPASCYAPAAKASTLRTQQTLPARPFFGSVDFCGEDILQGTRFMKHGPGKGYTLPLNASHASTQVCSVRIMWRYLNGTTLLCESPRQLLPSFCHWALRLRQPPLVGSRSSTTLSLSSYVPYVVPFWVVYCNP